MSHIPRSTTRQAVVALQLLIIVAALLTIAPPMHSRPLVDEQVPFTATATAVITGVTHLPGGLTQVNFNTSGKANHLGDFTGPLTRLQDNQGNFGSTAVIVGAVRKLDAGSVLGAHERRGEGEAGAAGRTAAPRTPPQHRAPHRNTPHPIDGVRGHAVGCAVTPWGVRSPLGCAVPDRGAPCLIGVRTGRPR